MARLAEAGGRDMIPWIFADIETIIDSYSEPKEADNGK